MDALALGSIKSCVESMTKSQLLSCFKQISKTSLRRILVAMLAPHCTVHVASNKLLDSNEVKLCRQHLKQQKNSVSQYHGPNDGNAFTSLPLAIGGYILSFCTMKERLLQTLTGRDIYLFSKHPVARYHFVVDEKFALALYNDQVQLHWFYNAQYIELKFAFRDGNRETFEEKYYASLAQIIRKSPLLHTLNYDLTHHSFRTSLRSSHEIYHSYHGHLLQWIYNIREHDASRSDVFHSLHAKQ